MIFEIKYVYRSKIMVKIYMNLLLGRFFMSKMKNMLIVKNINSNLVEEAIVVFKENVKIKEENFIKYNKSTSEEKALKNDLCVKEAEIIINDYISKVENKTKEERLMKKCKYLKVINIALVIVAIFFALV